MHIITLEDQDFPALLEAWADAKQVGKYWNKGNVQVVRATRQFVLVTRGDDSTPKKIALRPARSLGEAETLAIEFLKTQADRGNDVELEEILEEIMGHYHTDMDD